MSRSPVDQTSRAGYQPLKALQFARESLGFGFTTFYKAGIVWWILTAAYSLIDFLAGPSAYESGFRFPVMLLAVSSAFLLLLIKYPYLVIGLNFHRKGVGALDEDSISMSAYRSFAVVCLILAFTMIPAFFLLTLDLKNTDFLDILLFAFFIAAALLLLIRLFPLLFVVIDKNLDPLKAVKLSWKMTSSEFIPVFVLMLALAIIEGVFSLIPYGAGALVSTPVNYLASIHAYKLLDLNYEMAKIGTISM